MVKVGWYYELENRSFQEFILFKSLKGKNPLGIYNNEKFLYQKRFFNFQRRRKNRFKIVRMK